MYSNYQQFSNASHSRQIFTGKMHLSAIYKPKLRDGEALALAREGEGASGGPHQVVEFLPLCHSGRLA